MQTKRLRGLIAATYTPLTDQGEICEPPIRPMVDQLLDDGVEGFYVCGSTGEGMSLTSSERCQVAKLYVDAVEKRAPVIVQVGHNSLAEAAQLAAHAHSIGADAISATCPSYYKVSTVEALVDCMAQVAAGAPQTPFYYYHIPALTGSTIDMVDFLRRAGERIPNLVGLKYTAATMHEFQQCVELDDGRFDVVWGYDEMLLGALAIGATAAIGSTYNIAAKLYVDLIRAFQAGDMPEARRLQSLSVSMIRVMCDYPFHPATKSVLAMKGFAVGGCRLPLGRLSENDISTLKESLTDIGFFDWS